MQFLSNVFTIRALDYQFSFAGPPYYSSPSTAKSDALLKRRGSDKDKERRLVRRNSSKKKDKENGGKAPAAISVSAEAATTCSSAVATSGGGHPSPADVCSMAASAGVRGPLKRTGSAEVTSNNNNHHAHPLLFRTGSEDSPASTDVKDGLTRSLPRI